MNNIEQEDDYSVDIDSYTYAHDLDEYDLYGEIMTDNENNDDFGSNLILE